MPDTTNPNDHLTIQAAVLRALDTWKAQFSEDDATFVADVSWLEAARENIEDLVAEAAFEWAEANNIDMGE